MISTFAGIEIGKRSLVAHTQGLNTVGHNMANASTEGYSRQRVELTTLEPLYAPSLEREETPGQIGMGVVVERIERVRDELLEGRIVAQGSREGYWKVTDKYALMLEDIYNEPGDSSVRKRMDEFWGSWEALSANPGDTAARKAVLERGESLLDGVHDRYARLKGLRDMVEGDVGVTVGRITSLSKQIADLNGEIVKVKAMGDDPNDLLDRRDMLVGELSGLVDVSVSGADPDEFVVSVGGKTLVQGRAYREIALKTDPADNEGYAKVVWKDDGRDFDPRSGELRALLELRDVTIRGEIQKLDTMALNFADLVNEVHKKGWGANGKTGVAFFEEYPFVTNLAGNYDRDGDGTYDSTWLFRMTGKNVLDPKAQVGLAGKISLPGKDGDVAVEYYPTDRVADIVERINNSGAEVTARIDSAGKLALKATASASPGSPDFVIRSLADTGQFLVGYAGVLAAEGAGGAYAWDRPDAALALAAGSDYAVAPFLHPAGWIGLSAAVKGDPLSIAAGLGEGGNPAKEGDGGAALAIARLRTGAVMVGRDKTFDDFFANAVADIALKGEQAGKTLKTEQEIMKSLKDMRDAISGVNIDEELSQMIKYQHGYAAAARFISTFNEMLDTIINRLGV